MYKCEHYTDSLFYQLEKTAKYCRYLGHQAFTRLNFPITPDEFAALDVMLVHGEICQRDLAKLILKDRPNTGRILDSLENKGYIERFADTKNNRLVKRMRLTESGKNTLQETAEILREHISKMKKIFSDKEKDNLKRMIITFRESLENEVEVNI